MLHPFKAIFPIPDKKDSTSSKKKGDTLELIVEELCAGYENAKVSRNVQLPSKANTSRQIDVLIEATLKSFDIKIIVEAKNYQRKVDVEVVDAFRSKLSDVGGNVGVIVCPIGFTEGAIKSAGFSGIQLFQAFDHKLGNTTQLIPLRFIASDLKKYQLQIASGAMDAHFELPIDNSTWRFEVGGKLLNLRELATYAWNNRMVPQIAGEHVADFSILKVSVNGKSEIFFYLEVKVSIVASEDYYLKLFPASYMKNIASGKSNHQLKVDAYSKQEDMLKNGWKHFNTLEEIEAEAEKYDTSPDVRGLRIRPESVYGENKRNL